MGFSVVEAAKARCMRRKRGELRLLRRAAFWVGAEDFLRDLAGFDCGLAGEVVALSEACADSGTDEHTRALKHSAMRMNLENPATFP
jgi:hypothetical protein